MIAAHRVRCTLVVTMLFPVAARAQTATVAPDPAPASCTLRSEADTGRVVLADSAAPKQWSRETLGRVARHQACVGMTADMLRKSWGLPRSVYQVTPLTAGDTTAQYFYHGVTVVLVNGIVRAIRPREARARPERTR